MLEFQEFWNIYKSNIPLIDQLGFEHWWSLNWLERAKFENNKIHQGMILYNVQDNLIFSAKVAFLHVKNLLSACKKRKSLIYYTRELQHVSCAVFF
jgi:hypothetical protein